MSAVHLRHRALIIILLIFSLCTLPAHAQKRLLVKTQWNIANGLQNGDEIYFLSYYSLYLPGRVILPMFIVTPAKRLYSDLSLYRLSAGRLMRVWSYGPGLSGKKVDLQFCKAGRSGDRLYFQWTGEWDDEKKQSILPVLEYNLKTGAARNLEGENLTGNLVFQNPDNISASKIWERAGPLTLKTWDLPSPLEYSSDRPSFLIKVIVKNLGDRELKTAALSAMDSSADPDILKKTLSGMGKERRKNPGRSYASHYEEWTALILMTNTLQQERAPDIFSASYNNNTALVKQLIETGTDPNSTDEEGRTPLMYAVFGNAPDTLRLLFETGADPEQESGSGNIPWFYAALSPLRHLYLELWKKIK